MCPRVQLTTGKELAELTSDDLTARLREARVEMAATYAQELHSLIRERKCACLRRVGFVLSLTCRVHSAGQEAWYAPFPSSPRRTRSRRLLLCLSLQRVLHLRGVRFKCPLVRVFVAATTWRRGSGRCPIGAVPFLLRSFQFCRVALHAYDADGFTVLRSPSLAGGLLCRCV